MSSKIRTIIWPLAVCCSLGLTACQTLPNSPEERLNTSEVYSRSMPTDTSSAIATRPDDPLTTERDVPGSQRGAGSSESLGNGRFISPTYSGAFSSFSASQDPVSFAFENAPISEVVDQVISKTLGADFVIDPSVNGTLTFRVQKTPKSDLPRKLNDVLSVSGFALVQTSPSSFVVVPQSAASRFQGAPQMAEFNNGAGPVIYPLKWVSAQEMTKALQPFIPQGASVEIDSTREALIFAGTPSQVETLIETTRMFDVDWLAEMSFGVYETINVPPEAMVEELEKVYGGEVGPIGSQVEFVALSRLSSILVISKRPERLRQAENWIRRLDVNISGEGREFRFLSVQSADAEALADTLSEMFEDDFYLQGGQSRGQDGSSGFGLVGRDPDRVRIRADKASNALIIYSTDAEFRQIRTLMQRLDVLPDQVLIEVVIAEVTLTDDLRYGVQWFFDSRDGGAFTFSDAGAGTVSARFPGFAYTFSGSYVQAALSALSSVTDLEVVSSPQIVTQDNQAATLQVGDQVPVVTQSAVSVENPNAPIVNSVQYRDTGILLTVTPRINDGDVVVLEVSQEVSSAVPTSSSGIDAPTIQQRQFNSVVNIRDGETLALGGLIRSTRSRGKTGLPLVKDIPLLGNFFSGESDDRNRTELVIFLTPHIIRNGEDGRKVTEYIKDKMPSIRSRFEASDGQKVN